MSTAERAEDTDSNAALAKLRARGLTPVRVAEAEQLVAQLVQPSHGALPDLQQLRVAVEKSWPVSAPSFVVLQR